MSKLSFRARALDPSKLMPIYLAEELPDLPEYSAINRAVPQMPSGMEKEEESEHHLQRAICAGLIIPTPEVYATEQQFYDRCYPPTYKMPRQLIHMQPLGLENEVPEYDMDSADEAWVNNQSKRLNLTPLKFEQMMDRLERSSGQTVVTLNEAKTLLKQDDETSIAMYDYWLNKRLKTQHPLILTVKTETRPGISSNNPYLAFRRRTEKMQTRKNRKNDETSYEKMLKLRRDLQRATTLLEMVKKRETTKKEHLQLAIQIFEKRVELGDFNGALYSELCSNVKTTRPAFTLLYSNQYSHHTSSSASTPTSGMPSMDPSGLSSTMSSNLAGAGVNHVTAGSSGNIYQNNAQYLNSANLGIDGNNSGIGNGSRKEKRQYKKRKHKSQRDKQKQPQQYSAGGHGSATENANVGPGYSISHPTLPHYLHNSPAGHDSNIETEEDELLHSGGYGSNQQNKADAECEEDWPFAFRRKQNLNYLKPLDNVGNWPWESKEDQGLGDPKYRFTLTSIRNPRPRCVGFARRRVGRGGRIILDRIATDWDDLWSELDYTILESNTTNAANATQTSLALSSSSSSPIPSTTISTNNEAASSSSLATTAASTSTISSLALSRRSSTTTTITTIAATATSTTTTTTTSSSSSIAPRIKSEDEKASISNTISTSNSNHNNNHNVNLLNNTRKCNNAVNNDDYAANDMEKLSCYHDLESLEDNDNISIDDSYISGYITSPTHSSSQPPFNKRRMLQRNPNDEIPNKRSKLMDVADIKFRNLIKNILTKDRICKERLFNGGTCKANTMDEETTLPPPPPSLLIGTNQSPCLLAEDVLRINNNNNNNNNNNSNSNSNLNKNHNNNVSSISEKVNVIKSEATPPTDDDVAISIKEEIMETSNHCSADDSNEPLNNLQKQIADAAAAAATAAATSTTTTTTTTISVEDEENVNLAQLSNLMRHSIKKEITDFDLISSSSPTTTTTNPASTNNNNNSTDISTTTAATTIATTTSTTTTTATSIAANCKDSYSNAFPCIASCSSSTITASSASPSASSTTSTTLSARTISALSSKIPEGLLSTESQDSIDIKIEPELCKADDDDDDDFSTNSRLSPTTSQRLESCSVLLHEIRNDWLHFRPKTPSDNFSDEEDSLEFKFKPGATLVPWSQETPISVEMLKVPSLFGKTENDNHLSIWNTDIYNDALYVTNPFKYCELDPDSTLLKTIMPFDETFASSSSNKSPEPNAAANTSSAIDFNLSGDSLNELNLLGDGDETDENMLDNFLQECQIDDKTLNQATNFFNGILDDTGNDEDVPELDTEEKLLESLDERKKLRDTKLALKAKEEKKHKPLCSYGGTSFNIRPVSDINASDFFNPNYVPPPPPSTIKQEPIDMEVVTSEASLLATSSTIAPTVTSVTITHPALTAAVTVGNTLLTGNNCITAIKEEVQNLPIVDTSQMNKISNSNSNNINNLNAASSLVDSNASTSSSAALPTLVPSNMPLIQPITVVQTALLNAKQQQQLQQANLLTATEDLIVTDGTLQKSSINQSQTQQLQQQQQQQQQQQHQVQLQQQQVQPTQTPPPQLQQGTQIRQYTLSTNAQTLQRQPVLLQMQRDINSGSILTQYVQATSSLNANQRRHPTLTPIRGTPTTGHLIYTTSSGDVVAGTQKVAYIQKAPLSIASSIANSNTVTSNNLGSNTVITLSNVKLENDIAGQSSSVGNNVITLENNPGGSSSGVSNPSNINIISTSRGQQLQVQNIQSLQNVPASVSGNQITSSTPLIVTTTSRGSQLGQQVQGQPSQQIVWRQCNTGSNNTATAVLTTNVDTIGGNKILWTSRTGQKRQLNGPEGAELNRILKNRMHPQRKVITTQQHQQHLQQQQDRQNVTQQQQQQQQQRSINYTTNKIIQQLHPQYRLDEDGNIQATTATIHELNQSNNDGTSSSSASGSSGNNSNAGNNGSGGTTITHNLSKVQMHGKVIKMTSLPLIVSELQQKQNLVTVGSGNHNYSIQSTPVLTAQSLGQTGKILLTGNSGNASLQSSQGNMASTSNAVVSVAGSSGLTKVSDLQHSVNSSGQIQLNPTQKVHYKDFANSNLKLNFVSTSTANTLSQGGNIILESQQQQQQQQQQQTNSQAQLIQQQNSSGQAATTILLNKSAVAGGGGGTTSLHAHKLKTIANATAAAIANSTSGNVVVSTSSGGNLSNVGSLNIGDTIDNNKKVFYTSVLNVKNLPKGTTAGPMQMQIGGRSFQRVFKGRNNQTIFTTISASSLNNNASIANQQQQQQQQQQTQQIVTTSQANQIVSNNSNSGGILSSSSSSSGSNTTNIILQGGKVEVISANQVSANEFLKTINENSSSNVVVNTNTNTNTNSNSNLNSTNSSIQQTITINSNSNNNSNNNNSNNNINNNGNNININSNSSNNSNTNIIVNNNNNSSSTINNTSNNNNNNTMSINNNTINTSNNNNSNISNNATTTSTINNSNNNGSSNTTTINITANSSSSNNNNNNSPSANASTSNSNTLNSTINSNSNSNSSSSSNTSPALSSITALSNSNINLNNINSNSNSSNSSILSNSNNSTNSIAIATATATATANANASANANATANVCLNPSIVNATNSKNSTITTTTNLINR